MSTNFRVRLPFQGKYQYLQSMNKESHRELHPLKLKVRYDMQNASLPLHPEIYQPI